MSGPKCPCRQDCRERSGRCHAACQKYLAYEKEKMRSYREKQRRRESTELSDGARRNLNAFDRAYRKGEEPMENELILDGIGTCRFCGQAVAIQPLEGETREEAAVGVCDCPDARRYRLRLERVERSQEMIDEMFGPGCEEAYESKPVPEETLQLLKDAAVLAIDGKLTKTTVQVGGICKAEIGVGGKGEIKVKRTEGRTISTEE